MSVERLPEAAANASAFFVEEPTVSQVHGSVEVHGAVSEYTLEVPLELSSNEILAWVNGFGAFKKTMRGIGRETAARNIPNVRFRPIRRSDRSTIDTLTDATLLHVDTLDAVLDDIARNPQLADVPNGDKLNMGSVVLGPHSYGGETATRYSLEHPDNVSGVVYIEAVGLEDPELLRFIKRLPGSLVSEILPFVVHSNRAVSVWDAPKSLEYFFASIAQTGGEIVACCLSDNRQKILQFAPHIGTAILSGDKDKLVPADPMEKVAAHIVDYYERLDIDHVGPQRVPGVVSDGVKRAITAIKEAKQPNLTVVNS